MRHFKRVALVSAIALAVGIIPVTEVSAAEKSWFKTTELETSDITFVEDTQVILTKGNYLSSGHVQLSNLGNRKLAISGNTSCHVKCDKVTCNLYIERMDTNGNWYTYKYWTLSTTNAYSYSPERTATVEGGHWYRARGGHSASENGVLESITTMTDGIWVP